MEQNFQLLLDLFDIDGGWEDIPVAPTPTSY
jgi:hypothetical protein